MENLTASTAPLTRSAYRIESIDLLRGLIMIIMALDHTRDFFHKDAFTQDPLSMETTTPILFFTRWITHFCAPVFVFLSGTSAYFQSLRKSKKELSIFLIKRGLWLILLEIFLINLLFTFDISFGLIGLQVIWAIGISMVLLALVIWLPFPVIAVIGFIIVLGHNSLDFYEAGLKESPGWWYDLLHRFGFYNLWGKHNLVILYPFLSWTGLMILDYCFGKVFLKKEGAERRKLLTWIGVAIILFFIALRATEVYGDPIDWAPQKNTLFTIFSFINTQKYPPSLLYMCMTIGPAILFLAWVRNVRTSLAKFITVYGRVPFFYYILHFFLIHLVSAICYLARGHSVEEGLADSPNLIAPKFVAPGEGYSLGVVYVIWILIVLFLYPFCKWYSDYKLTHRKWWLSYL